MAPGPPSSLNAACAFDRHAANYDGNCRNPILSWIRSAFHSAVFDSFPPGVRLLEIGCGTGIDAAFLSRDYEIVACDPAPAMVAKTVERLHGLPEAARVRVVRSGLEEFDRCLEALDSGEGGAPEGGAGQAFDGIYSNFGALNCVERLDSLAQLATRRLAPSGRLVLNLMNRTCLSEWLFFMLRGDRGRASRRAGRGAVNVAVEGIDVPTFYHRPADILAALGSDFRLISLQGLAVFLPPPAAHRTWQRLPEETRRALVLLEHGLSRRFPFHRFGDHFLMVIERR